jgi:hypothetical protein
MHVGGSVFAAVAFAWLVAACASDPERPPPAVDGPTPGGSGVGGGTTHDSGTPPDADFDVDDAGACNDLPNTGFIVEVNAFSEDLPASVGGAIVEGDYDLTSASVYVGAQEVGGPRDITLRSSISISAETIQQVLVTRSGASDAVETRTKLLFTVRDDSDTAITVRVACPKGGRTYELGYTAEATRFSLHDPQTNEVFIFTKR